MSQSAKLLRDRFRPSGFQLDVLYALANGDRIQCRRNKRGNPTDAVLVRTGFVLPIRSANLMLQRGWIKRFHGAFYVIDTEGLLTIARNEKGLLDAHERPVGRQR